MKLSTGTFFTLLTALLVASCQSPVGASRTSPGTLTVQFGAPPRSIVADLESLVSSYHIELTSDDGFPSQSKTATSAGSVTFDGLIAGIWDITVTAMNGTTVLAKGTVLNHSISASEGGTISVTLSASQDTTGGFEFHFSLPSSTLVDSVVGQLYSFEGAPVGSGLIATLSTSDGTTSGVITGTGVVSGRLRLALDFRRGGASGTLAGAYSEAVTIWDNLTSDKWLGNDGLLHSARNFTADDFSSTNSHLSNLTFRNAGEIALVPVPGFSSVVQSYDLAVGGVVRLTPTQSLAGQKIEYKKGSGPWTALPSGTTSDGLTMSGTSEIDIRVTAPDRQSTTTYAISARSGAVLYSAAGADSGSAPADTTAYDSNATVTVKEDAGTLVKASRQVAGWNTKEDGTGTTYALGSTLTRGDGDLILYPIWLDERLQFYGEGSDLSVTGMKTTIVGSVTVPEGFRSIGSAAFANCSTLTGISLPSTLTALYNSAFMGCSNLAAVNIPDGLTTIASGAFFGCSSITAISVPSATTTLGSQAFQGCSALAEIVVAAANPNFKSVGGVVYDKAATTLLIVPTSLAGAYVIPDTVTAIKDSAFNGCSLLTGITIPEGVTSIGESAFYCCVALTSVTLPSTLTSIGGWAFASCFLLQNIAVPASVETIGEQAFGSCEDLVSIDVSASNENYSSLSHALYNKDQTTLLAVPAGLTGSFSIAGTATKVARTAFIGCALTSITIPASVTALGDAAFQSCQNLTSIIIPDTVTSLGDNLFAQCLHLESVTLPDAATAITDWMFSNCLALTSLTLPSGLTSIGEYAFYGAGLTSITVPSGVTSLGKWTFTGCPLETAVMNPTTPPTLPEESLAFEGANADLEIRVPSASVDDYQAAAGWSAYETKIVSL